LNALWYDLSSKRHADGGPAKYIKPDNFSDARVLVTGGAGIIGSALV